MMTKTSHSIRIYEAGFWSRDSCVAIGILRCAQDDALNVVTEFTSARSWAAVPHQLARLCLSSTANPRELRKLAHPRAAAVCLYGPATTEACAALDREPDHRTPLGLFN